MQFSQRDEIATSRLVLIAVTPEMIRSEQVGDKRLGELIRCTIPTNWPLTHWEPHVFDFLLTQFDQHPDQIGWPRYIALPHPDGSRTLIGSLGAFTKPATPSEREIGYGILPPYEGRGFATEATKALIELLRNDKRLTTIIAHTYPTLIGSIRIMEKCGLTFDGDGEETGTIRYKLQLRAST